MKLKLSDIARACGGVLYGEDFTAASLATDSRKVQSGCVFAALKGERADGNDFIPSLDRIPQVCYLTDRAPAGVSNPYIVVKDVLCAIGDIARLHLSQMPARRVAVTGSVGKTTTKNFVASALGACAVTRCSQGNRNNELGLPLTVLETAPTDEILVLEMGMRGFGQIDYLCRIARPDVAIITNIGVAHMELLGSRENILKAKSEIIAALPPEGVAVLNADDDLLTTLCPDRKTVWFGIENERCDIRAVRLVNNTFVLQYEGEEYPVNLSVSGRHNVYNALAAIGAGVALGYPVGALIGGVETFAGDGQRQNIYQFGGIRIFDDTYNASPASMTAAMEVMGQYPGRKVLALADMLELGALTKQAHEGLVSDIEKLGADAVVCIGEHMKYLYDVLPKDRMTVCHCDSWREALPLLLQVLREGDNLLCKGSHSMQLDQLLIQLKEALSQ